MKERIRKYLGWALLGLSIVTLLIIPWLIVEAIASKVKESRERNTQIENAQSFALHNYEVDPYAAIFSNDPAKIKQYKEMIEKEEEPGFLNIFYKKAIGRVEEERPSQKFLREAYESKPPTSLLKDIFNLLKNSFGRYAFACSHAYIESQLNPPQNKAPKSSPAKLSALNTRKRLRRSSSDEFLKKATKNSQKKVTLEILKNENPQVKDKWKQEEALTPGNEGKTFKI